MEPFTRGLGTEGSIYLFFFLHCNSRSHGFPLFPAKISYFHVPRAYTCFILSLVPNLETRLGLHRPGWHARRQRVIRCSTDYSAVQWLRRVYDTQTWFKRSSKESSLLWRFRHWKSMSLSSPVGSPVSPFAPGCDIVFESYLHKTPPLDRLFVVRSSYNYGSSEVLHEILL